MSKEITPAEALAYWEKSVREQEKSLAKCRERWEKATGTHHPAHADFMCGLEALDLIRARLYSDRARDDLGQSRVYA